MAIKGITIEIGGDTQKLNKALEDVNKKSKGIQAELKQVERLLKLDPKNTELLAQKQKLLADAVANSKDKLDRLKTAQIQVNEQFKKGEISEEQYRAFQREVVKAEQELQGFEKRLKNTADASKALGDKLTAAGTKMKDVGGTMTKYLTVPLAGVSAGAVAMGKTFDDAYDKIRIGTGATGRALQDLHEDFRNTVKRVPSSLDEVSTAIADYNTRLGISGQALENLSVQTLNLARITDSDLGKIIEETSQSFQAFNIPVVEYGDALDYVFKVAQSTGIGIDRLQVNLVKFAPALKQMGFDFQESAALIGYFDKAGVEVEQAMTGLNKALVNMAKMGVPDAHDALKDLFDRIKNAPDDIKAAELAIELFGAKAGPLMAVAIREGKLGYEELVKELQASKETINGVASETDDWSEHLKQLKNNIMVATEPITSVFFDALNGLVPLIESVVPPLEKLANWFANLPASAQIVILALSGLVAAVGPLLQGIGAVVMAGPGLIAIFGKMAAAGTALSGVFGGIAGALPALGAALGAITAPIAIAIAAIAALVAGGVWLWKHWDETKAKATEVWESIGSFLTRTLDGIKQRFTAIWTSIKEFFKRWGDEILLLAIGPAGWLVLLGRKIANNWDVIRDKAYNVWNNLKGWLNDTWKSIKDISSTVWEGIRETITNPIKRAQETIFDIIGNIKRAFANLRIEIPKPKLPHISVNWRPVGVGEAKINIPDFDLNWYRTGGIFSRPSVIGVGESGPEAVVPLNKLPTLIAGALKEVLSGNQVAMAGGDIVIQNMHVRNAQDINLIARELYNLQQQNARGRGLR